MVRVLQSLVVRLSSQAIQSESSKTGRSPHYGKRGKEEVPEEIKEEFQNDEYDLDSFGDAFVMMPKLEEDKRQKNLEKNIKKEWLEDFE